MHLAFRVRSSKAWSLLFAAATLLPLHLFSQPVPNDGFSITDLINAGSASGMLDGRLAQTPDEISLVAVVRQIVKGDASFTASSYLRAVYKVKAQTSLVGPFITAVASSANPAISNATLPAFAGGQFTDVFGVANVGTANSPVINLVGASAKLNTPAHAALWTVSGTKLTVKDLGTRPGDNNSKAYAINAHGQIVGESNSVAVLWSINTSAIQTLGTLPDGFFSQGSAINDAGQITGWSYNASARIHAFLYENGNMSDLGVLEGGTTSYGNAISPSGEIVGNSTVSGGDLHAFAYVNGDMTDLGVLSGGANSTANSVNDSGLVVGQSTVSGGKYHAVLWDANGTIQDLNDLAPNATLTYVNAVGINAEGDMVVDAVDGKNAPYVVAFFNGTLGPSGTAPKITSQPGSTAVTVGQMATFSVTANGTATLKYQWSSTIKGVTKKITGATKTTYSIARVATTNAGLYSVAVSNTFGNVTSAPATLTVKIPPKISTQPKSFTLKTGGNVTFTVVLAAGATPPVNYQWQFTKTPPTGFANLPSATAPSYTITGVAPVNQGSYRVLVTGSGVTVTSSAGKLTVKP